MKWDPDQYGRFSSQRSRPFFDLVAQISATEPQHVADLGCGPGELTVTLAQRWPNAVVHGVDSSPEMIERASAFASARVRFSLSSAEAFSATGVDVLVSNAMLQWVPGQSALLTRWAAELNPGGWLAFQVPANFDSPSHQLMRSLTSSARWRDQLADVLRHDEALAPTDYLGLLTAAGLDVDVWQTSYLHVLTGENPVLEWVRGTGLRPILAALSAPDAAEFEAAYAALLRDAYPQQAFGTVFAFLRTFVVARKP